MHTLDSMEYIIYNKEIFRDLSYLLRQRPFVCLIISPSVDWEVSEGRDQRFPVIFFFL